LINGKSPIVQREKNIMDEEINKTSFVQKSIAYQNEAVELKQENQSILTLQDQEIKMIKESLKRHQGRRKDAADELGISERTLYRKIKEYKL
jgi:transcriptional regulator with PAS, ATPase and Fis domain